MSRPLLLAGSVSVLILAVPALGADYPSFPDLRPSYPGVLEETPLRFETGVRYWYSWGGQTVGIAGETYTTSDRSHVLEAHFRIDDDLTDSFVKGQAGYAFMIDGNHSSSVDPGQYSFSGGQVGYVTGDFGWTPFGNDSIRVGALTGYQFLRESPDRNLLDVDHFDGLNIHALRLGVTAHANLGGMFDVDAELVGVPYAYAHGATADLPSADEIVQGVTVNRSNMEVTGALFGASGQIMVGIHPTENLTLRFGGRASMLTGNASVTNKQWNVATPEQFLYNSAPLDSLSLVRFGVLAELTGRF